MPGLRSSPSARLAPAADPGRRRRLGMMVVASLVAHAGGAGLLVLLPAAPGPAVPPTEATVSLAFLPETPVAPTAAARQAAPQPVSPEPAPPEPTPPGPAAPEPPVAAESPPPPVAAPPPEPAVPPPPATAPSPEPAVPPPPVAAPSPESAVPPPPVAQRAAKPPPAPPLPRRAEARPSPPVRHAPPAPADSRPVPTAFAHLPAQSAELPFVPPRPVAGLAGNRPPTYPERAREHGEQGRVLLRVEVSAEGLPVAVTVARSSGHPILDEAAVAAVRRWRFDAATRGGIAVPAPAEVPVQFTLAD